MFQFTDPVMKESLSFAMIKFTDLRPGRYQRTLSTTFAGQMTKSMVNGFICPILVSEDGEGGYEVLDGQHRIYALSSLGANVETEVPCIVLPPKFKNMPLIFNVEKDDNIKDICAKLYRLYVDFVENFGEEMQESAVAGSAMGQPYYITLAFAHMEFGLDSPSLVESVVKKLDRDFFQTILMDAVDVRKEMAQKAKELEQVVAAVAMKYRISDYNLKKSIISKTSMDIWGRARSAAEPYMEGMDLLIQKIEATDWSWMAGR